VVVRDIMDAEPVTVGVEDTVETVVHLLRRHELPGLPVVDPRGDLVGIVTENDLVITDDEGEDLHVPHYIELFGGIVFLEPLRRFEGRLRKATAATVQDLMTADPVTVAPGATVREAGRVIVERGHNRLPVVEDGHRLVGVVTRVDVLEALTQEG
jgi:CBS domain-containing protein